MSGIRECRVLGSVGHWGVSGIGGCRVLGACVSGIGGRVCRALGECVSGIGGVCVGHVSLIVHVL